jgi:MFS transporter, MHS family, shikimate and dehydroshikimate transport protein
MTVAQPRADLGAASDEVATHTLLKVAFASAIGTIVEWYDFFIYGYRLGAGVQQAVLPKLRSAGRLIALATYGAGFFARPIGGLPRSSGARPRSAPG